MTIQDLLCEYFTEIEMSSLLGVIKSTLQKRRCMGSDHPPFIKVGKQILYPKHLAKAWLKNQPVHSEIGAPKLRAVK